MQRERERAPLVQLRTIARKPESAASSLESSWWSGRLFQNSCNWHKGSCGHIESVKPRFHQDSPHRRCLLGGIPCELDSYHTESTGVSGSVRTEKQGQEGRSGREGVEGGLGGFDVVRTAGTLKALLESWSDKLCSDIIAPRPRASARGRRG